MSKNPEIEKLRREIETFRERRGLSRSAFGVWAINDPNLMRNLDAGRDLRWATICAIRSRMENLKDEKHD